MNISITGTGSYLPSEIIANKDFISRKFLNPDGSTFKHSNQVIIEKFKSITGIAERRYAENRFVASDLAFFAAEKAIVDANIDKETLDYIIFAHNFGDVPFGECQADTVPSLATRVKHLLEIKNPRCVAYDLLFGCPGWIEGVLQAKAFIKSGVAKKCLVIGAETLSRVVDKNDRDAMIYSDGAGAAIIEAAKGTGDILSHVSATYANEEAKFLFFGKSYGSTDKLGLNYIKMYGRKIYEFAITHVPQAMKECLDQSGVAIGDLKKILIHQANEKMDEAIVKRFYQLYGIETPDMVMPMSIGTLGNSSVATIPTLLDLVRKNGIADQDINEGDVIMFASVGAGMNVNAITYRV